MNADKATTILGAVSGILSFWGNAGFVLPGNTQEFAALLGSAAIVGLGYFTNKQ